MFLGSAVSIGAITEWSGAMGNGLESIAIIPRGLDAPKDVLLYFAAFKIHTWLC
jgi:hypothetical protein